MPRLRWVAITLAPPLVYVMVLYLATRPPKPVYTFARHTVMTVTDKGGPAILHAPPARDLSAASPARQSGRQRDPECHDCRQWDSGAGRADIGPGALAAGGHRQRAAVAVRGQGARDADRRRVFATLRDARC